MKPTPVSSNVVHMWTQSEPSIHFVKKRSQILEGELKSKGSIHSFLLAISHSAKKRTRSTSCKERANHACCLSFFETVHVVVLYYPSRSNSFHISWKRDGKSWWWRASNGDKERILSGTMNVFAIFPGFACSK